MAAIVIQLLALAFSLVSGSPWPAVAVTAVLIGLTCRELWGGRLSFALCLTMSILTVFAVLILTSAFSLGMNATVTAVSTAIGLATAAVRFAHPAAVRPLPGLRSILPWLGAASGAVLTMGALAVSTGLPASARFDWVMRNDSLNNLTFARLAMDRQGIALGPDENPAPLPSALIAITSDAGRGHVASTGLLEHDLAAMAFIWAVLISLCAFAAGLLAATIVLRVGGPRWFATTAAAIGSLLVLSWLVTGYPLEYGFINTHVSILIAIVAMIAALEAPRAPWPAVSVTLACCVLMLATWAPLVVIPAALCLVLVITYRAQLLSLRGTRATIVIGAVTAVVLYGLAVALPILIEQRQALSARGGIYDTGHYTVFVVGAVLVVLAVATFRDRRSAAMWSVIAVVVATWAAVGALLFNGRYLPDPWSYYTVKLAWLSLVIYLIVGVGILLAALVRLTAKTAIRAAGLVVVAAACAVLMMWTPALTRPADQRNPLQFIAQANEPSGYPLLNSYVLDFAASEHPTILFRSGFTGEGWVDTWLMQLAAGDFESELRELPFSMDADKGIDLLCRAGELMGPGLVVHTRDVSLAAGLDDTCPDHTMTVVVEEPRRTGAP